jgi:hypothetical protein
MNAWDAAIYYIKHTSLRAFRAQAGGRRRTLGRALARTGHARVRSSAAGTAATSSRRSTAESPSPRRSAATSAAGKPWKCRWQPPLADWAAAGPSTRRRLGVWSLTSPRSGVLLPTGRRVGRRCLLSRRELSRLA